jgi:DNA-binding NarL/FixJ family response regulator
MTLRVLVVEDHQTWRRHVTSALRETRRCEIVGEVGDGLDAVDAALRLQPDLILLDIGLPGLTGIEAARRILAGAPQAKILFLSEHRSREVAEAAIAAGGRGYVLKSDAGRELLPAVEAVLLEHRYVSAGLPALAFEQLPRGPAVHQSRCHELEVCSSEGSVLDGFTRFAERGLGCGGAVLVFTSPAGRDTVHRNLASRGYDLQLAIAEGRFVSLDVNDVLGSVIVDGRLDDTRFWTAAIGRLEAAARVSRAEDRRVFVCGEGATTLWKTGNTGAALRLEHHWDVLARRYALDVFCGYSMPASLGEEQRRSFEQICAEHSAIHGF